MFSLSVLDWFVFVDGLVASIVVILAFSLLAYTMTYNVRHPVAQRFSLLLALVVMTYSSEVALNRVITADAAQDWLRVQWLGIALLPWAYYIFSNAVLETTNFSNPRSLPLGIVFGVLSGLCAGLALFTNLLVGEINYTPPISYLHAGPLFWPFAGLLTLAAGLALRNIWHARRRCLTVESRRRMNYLLMGFIAPGVGTFPYLVVLGQQTAGINFATPILALSILGNMAVALLLVIMAYTVAYFGVYTPDRVVRYRLIRYFTRGPLVAIVVILLIQTIPAVERILGLPRDMVLFSVITGVIVVSQLALSITKTLVDRLIYREDKDEIAWLRELDRRLLTTSDLRQFLENHLTSICELMRVHRAFVAAIVGPDLILEAVVGPEKTRDEVLQVKDWTDALNNALKQGSGAEAASSHPTNDAHLAVYHYPPVVQNGFWIWPLVEASGREEAENVLGILAVEVQDEGDAISNDAVETKNERQPDTLDIEGLESMVDSIGLALVDRKLQKQVFVALRRIIPGIDRIQQIRGIVPYASNGGTPPAEMLEPSPIHNPEFESWVKDALSHYWGGPKLTRSPLLELRAVGRAMDDAENDPTKALRLVLGRAIERLRPDGKQDLSTPEWLLYNILEMRFIQGRKVREIADRLAISESDLYRKQRVAIGQVARVLTEIEQSGRDDLINPAPDSPPLTDSAIPGSNVNETQKDKAAKLL